MALGREELLLILKLRDEASRGLKAAADRTDAFSDKLKKIRLPLLAVAGAVVGVGIASLKFASDLEEAANKASEVFQENIDVVEEFSETSAESFAISKRAALEYTGTLGTILNATGIAGKASADMSIELVKLAADLSSFNNIPIDVALEKLRSGLVGEVEPLRTVGILLNSAAVEAKALELNLTDQSGKLSEAAKVQARYALILEATTTQQGDMQRTMGSLSNQIKQAKAQMEDLAAELGNELLPIATKGIVTLNKLVRVFAELPREVKLAGIGLTGLAGAVAVLGLAIPPLIAGIKALGAAAAFAAGPVGIGILIAALVVATAAFFLFKRAANEAAEAAREQQQVTSLSKLSVETLNILIAAIGAHRDALRRRRAELQEELATQQRGTAASAENVAELQRVTTGLVRANDELVRHSEALGNASMEAVAMAAAEDEAAGAVENIEKAARAASESLKELSAQALAAKLAADLLKLSAETGEFQLAFDLAVNFLRQRVGAEKEVEGLAEALLELAGFTSDAKDAADDLSDTTIELTEVQRRQAAAVEGIVQRQTSAVAAAYLEGLQISEEAAVSAVETVRAEQAALDEAWADIAKGLRDVLGTEVPDEFRAMWESILESQKESGKALDDAMREVFNTLVQRAQALSGDASQIQIATAINQGLITQEELDAIGAGNLSPAEILALISGGAGGASMLGASAPIEVSVTIGNKPIEDLIVEANTQAAAAGRVDT